MLKTILKSILKTAVSFAFKVKVSGALQEVQCHDRTILVANHASWLDGLLLATFLPVEPVFVVYKGLLGNFAFRNALKLVDYLPVDSTSPMAMKKVVQLIRQGRPVVVFPEGRLTTTGTLMKVYEGTSFAASRSNATIVPIRIKGAAYSRLTRLGGFHPRHWFPAISLTVLPGQVLPANEGLPTKKRRKLAAEDMRHLLQDMMSKTEDKLSLYDSLVAAAHLYGFDRKIMEDLAQIKTPEAGLAPYSYSKLLTASQSLGYLISKCTYESERVGILLPNVLATVGTIFGCNAFNRVPAMLNYKAGSQGLIDALTAGTIRTVITSRKFVTEARLESEVQSMANHPSVRLFYLEDMKANLTWRDKQFLVLFKLMPGQFDHIFPQLKQNRQPHNPAIVLFTSGSEGKPKGVVLSSHALASNIAQIRASFDFSCDDRVLNALPIFHSFGLTAGTLLPLLSGMNLVLYPTPLHYRIIPELAYDKNCTVLFGTNTFLAQYGKFADPYDFFQLRYVVAGAEKLSEPVRTLWFEKFGKRIFEGYGATETAPVIAVNTPKAYRIGTVGQILPGIEYQLTPVPGVPHGGALHVRGPNLMTGYLRYEQPGMLEPVYSEALGPGWYSTGDVVTVEDRFVTIIDRVKRFAKIGGEMISLTAMERFIDEIAPGYHHAVLSRPDPLKGEALVLFTSAPRLSRESISQALKSKGLSELGVPKQIVCMPELPLLGTGKIDYTSLKKQLPT